MVKRASTPKVNDTPPWVNPDAVDDYAEGRTMGQNWNCVEGLVAQLAVTADRERRAKECDIDTAMRVVSKMGLLDFNIRFLGVWCSYWWWGSSAVYDD